VAIDEVSDIIQNKYIANVENDKITEGAISGIMHSLDKYSIFFNKDDYKDFRSNTDGEFGGIGVEMTKLPKDTFATVTNVIEDAPAYNVGMQFGDLITHINSNSVVNLNIMQISKLIRGKQNTNVILTAYRPSNKQIYEFNLVRKEIKINSVMSKILPHNIALIEIKMFNYKTYDDFVKTIKKINLNERNGLIIDLRNNPGGLLDPAVDIANLFLVNGDLITTIIGKNGMRSKEYRAVNATKFINNIQIILLINGKSASSAEILAAALRENNVAALIGEKTFGKASVQELIELKSIPGTAVKVTTAMYYTPKNKMIHDVGIEPDITVKDIIDKSKNTDKILNEAINVMMN
jgi:carboxyl-terminal processing protease